MGARSERFRAACENNLRGHWIAIEVMIDGGGLKNMLCVFFCSLQLGLTIRNLDYSSHGKESSSENLHTLSSFATRFKN